MATVIPEKDLITMNSIEMNMDFTKKEEIYILCINLYICILIYEST